MLQLIPAGLHRTALQMAHFVRARFRRVFKLPIAGVCLIARDEAGRILMVRHSYGARLWAFPGGGCGRNEDPEDALHREMQEELQMKVGNLQKLATYEEAISGALHTAHVYAAEILSPPIPDGREIISAQMFAMDDLPEDLSALMRRRLALWQERLGI